MRILLSVVYILTIYFVAFILSNVLNVSFDNTLLYVCVGGMASIMAGEALNNG